MGACEVSEVESPACASLQELDSLEAELSACVASGEGDAFCAYLLGVVLLDK
jgi:hypothetical protein